MVVQKQSRSPTLTLLILVILVVGVAAAISGLSKEKSVNAADEIGASKVKHPIGDFKLTDEDGGLWTLKNVHGKVVLVNFWATWCPPCLEEFPSMQELKQSMDGQPFEILAINVGENDEDVFGFTASLDEEINFPVLYDHKVETAKQWRVQVMPTSVIVNHKGEALYRVIGKRDWNSESVKHFFTELIKSHGISG